MSFGKDVLDMINSIENDHNHPGQKAGIMMQGDTKPHEIYTKSEHTITLKTYRGIETGYRMINTNQMASIQLEAIKKP